MAALDLPTARGGAAGFPAGAEYPGQRPRQQAVFRVPGVEIVSQLLQGTFPSYEQLIPQESETRAVLDTKELQRAARSTEAFARSDTWA